MMILPLLIKLQNYIIYQPRSAYMCRNCYQITRLSGFNQFKIIRVPYFKIIDTVHSGAFKYFSPLFYKLRCISAAVLKTKTDGRK